MLIPVVVVGIRAPEPVQSIAQWLWVAVGMVLVVRLVISPLRPSAFRSSALLWVWLVFGTASLLWSPAPGRGLVLLASVFTAGLAYLWGFHAGPPPRADALRWFGAAGIAVAAVGLILFRDPSLVGGLNPDRIMAMGAISLTVAAWFGLPSRLWVVGTGLAALGVTVTSGSRAASVVLLILLLTAPGLRLARSARVFAAGAAVVVLLLGLGLPAVQSRWFTSGTGGIWDLVTVSDNLQTSGRREVWPAITDRCDQPVIGLGVGAADSYAQATDRGFPEPHNEYLRIWCDTGVVGSLLLWGFVILVGANAVRGLRTRDGSRSTRYAGLQFVAALALLSLTDNPLTTVVPFLVPAAITFGWAQSVRSPVNPRATSTLRQ